MSGAGDFPSGCKSLTLLDRLTFARAEAAEQRRRSAELCRRSFEIRTRRASLPGALPSQRLPEPFSARAVDDDPAQVAMAVIAVAVSAGGLEPLRTIAAALPPTLPAAVILAQHSSDRSVLPDLLRSWSRLPVMVPSAGDLVRGGHLYVAPPCQHLVVGPDRRFAVGHDKPIAHVRPSADWLFTSAAASFGRCTVAVILSGYGHDGTRGAQRIKGAGGTVYVQDPSTCGAGQMPTSALRANIVDAFLPPEEIAAAIVNTVERLDFVALRREWDEPFASAS